MNYFDNEYTGICHYISMINNIIGKTLDDDTASIIKEIGTKYFLDINRINYLEKELHELNEKYKKNNKPIWKRLDAWIFVISSNIIMIIFLSLIF